MESKILNIIDIEVDNNKVLIEYIYKHQKNKKVTPILDNCDDENIEIKFNTINYSSEIDITKIKIYIKELKPQVLNIKIKEDNQEYNTIILDNKDKEIVCYNNYAIFTKKHTIEILKDRIVIKNKKIFDKLKYEIKKQLYSLKIFKRPCLIRFLAKSNKKYYLFNDRIMYADDNAEQLFRHINATHKAMAKYSYFVLDKKSPKIKELKKVGKVLKFGTLRHKIKYLNSRMLISSHASYYDRVYNPFNEKEMELLKDKINKKFVFLQHGVTFNDVHKILNRAHIIADLFITTTNKEHEEILSEKYMYDPENVKCTGLSRFDRLENINENIILIAPTWRAYLTDAKFTNKDKQSFEESDFYMQYRSLLENRELLSKLKNSKYQIYFLLHPAFVQFKDEFNKYNNEIVKILTTKDISYSELFKKCSVFITDYSSTHFDVAFLSKPIIYYQFDKEKFYDSHYDIGYFNYEKDGFGDVIYKEENLIKELINYIDNKCNIKELYKQRINKTFKFLDRNNSERTYQEIKKIDSRGTKNYRFNNVH